jgi:CheY-like chemotaxis protein
MYLASPGWRLGHSVQKRADQIGRCDVAGTVPEAHTRALMSADGRINVLVADHNPWTRFCFARMLSEAGFDVDEASNGVSAVRRALADSPQVVIVGDRLSELSSSDVMLTLRSDPRMHQTALVQIAATCSSIELVATVIYALEEQHELGQQKEGRVHDRPQTGTPWVAPSACRPNARTRI